MNILHSIFLLLLCTLLSAWQLPAQTTRFSVAAVGHIEATDVYASFIRGYLESYRSRFSPGGRIACIWEFGRGNWAFESGLSFVDRGASTQLLFTGNPIVGPNGQPEREAFDVHLQYLGVPLLARFQTGRLYISVGPQVDVKVNGYQTYRNRSFKIPFQIIQDEGKTVQLSAVGSVGFRTPLGSRVHLLTEARVNPQIMNVLQQLDFRFVNYGFGVGLQYQIGN